MRWTCPKCGKKLDVSNEQLIANDGVIICPQCLLQAKQPVPKARMTPGKDKSGNTSSPKRKTISFEDTSNQREAAMNTPPPYKGRRKPASTSSQHNELSASDINTRKTKRAPAKKTSSSGKKKPADKSATSAWGCLGKTIIFTLLLFAAYIFFGMLLEALQ